MKSGLYLFWLSMVSGQTVPVCPRKAGITFCDHAPVLPVKLDALAETHFKEISAISPMARALRVLSGRKGML
jgi:hypothetical protein